MRLVSKLVKAGLHAASVGPGVSLLAAWPGAWRRRLARIDAIGLLIGSVDMLERGWRRSCRVLSHLRRARGLGLTGALLWRGAAALAGIGCTAALVTGLSAQDEDTPRLAALALRETPRTGAAPTSVMPAAAVWTPIARPIAIFHLEAPELGRAAPVYEASGDGGGGREDQLRFGGFAERTPYFVLRLRTGPGERRAGSFAVAMVREAAGLGLSIARSNAPAQTETRFGMVESADIALGDGDASRACVGFRSAPGAPGFAMSGWWCAAGKPSDRRQLTCLLDRLDLANAGGDPELRAVFAASELRRPDYCTRPHLSVAGRKTSWLDGDGALPTLRVKTAGAEPATPPPRPKRPPRQRRAR